MSAAARSRILAFLRGASEPMDITEIATALHLARITVSDAIQDLRNSKLIDRVWIRGRRNDTGDCEQQTFVMAGTYFRDDPRLPRDTIVITPTNREARVTRSLGDGYVEFEYLHERRKDARLGKCKATLLRPFIAGRGRPEPVRLC